MGIVLNDLHENKKDKFPEWMEKEEKEEPSSR